MATGIIFSGEFWRLRRIMVLLLLLSRDGLVCGQAGSGLGFVAVCAHAKGAEVEGDGEADEESAESVVDGRRDAWPRSLSKSDNVRPTEEAEIADGEKAAGFRREVSSSEAHCGFSFQVLRGFSR